MPSFQRISAMGHMGRDPETKHTPSGVAKTTFSVAVSDRWKDKSGEWKEDVEWFNVCAWRMDWLDSKLHKGDLVYVEGKMKTRQYEGRDGTQQKITELVADKVLPLSAKDKPAAGPQPVSTPRSAKQQTTAPATDSQSGFGITDDDVPF